MLVSVSALGSAAIAYATHVLAGWPACAVAAVFCAGMSALTFVYFGVDKARARSGGRRIREADLLGAALLGGAFGALLGMRRFRHKTRHLRFRIFVPTLLLLQVALLAYAASR